MIQDSPPGTRTTPTSPTFSQMENRNRNQDGQMMMMMIAGEEEQEGEGSGSDRNVPAPAAAASPVPDESSLEIVKDSAISVNVDDIGPGLIVASYAHSTGIYQGVLLQLNRDRGIPCGISFPKNYFGESNTNEPTSSNSEENTANPVDLRHTYFQQDKSNLKPLRRIVRATKPPARYKNGKLAMKFRNRPVLCSKCKAYCDEKNPPPKPTTLDETNKSKSTKKSGTAKTGKDLLVTTKTTMDSENENNPQLAEKSDGKTQPYETIGSGTAAAGIGIGFYWKRPEDPNKKLAKRAALEKATACSTNGSLETKKSNKAYQHRLQKLNSLIDKIKEKVMKKDEAGGFGVGVINALESFSQAQGQDLNNQDKEMGTSSESDRSTTTSPDAGSTKTRGNNKKRSSAVPARFRDEIWTTNVYDAIKRRRQSKTVNEKTGTLSSNEEAQGTLVSSPVDSTNSSLSKRTPESVLVLTDGFESAKGSNLSKPSPTTPTTSTKHNHAQVEKIDTAKNPAIKMKICLGSSSKGNGVYLEIPPATIELAESLVPETPPPQLSPTKDSRKSLRRAKKEAKRKLSSTNSVDSEPNIKPKKALFSTLPYDPPPPPLTLGPELKIRVAEPFKRKNKIEKQSNKSDLSSQIEPVIPELKPFTHSSESSMDYSINKKKKKEKKKKKDKWLKNNIMEIGSESQNSPSDPDPYEGMPQELDKISPFVLANNNSSSTMDMEFGGQDEDSTPVLPKLKISPAATGTLQNSPVPIRMSLKRVDSSNSYSFKSRVADRLSF